MELTVEKVNVNLENGTAIITGYDVSEVMQELLLHAGGDVYKILDEIETSEIAKYIAEIENDKQYDQ